MIEQSVLARVPAAQLAPRTFGRSARPWLWMSTVCNHVIYTLSVHVGQLFLGRLRPEFTNAIAAMLPANSHALMTFQIGYPTATALLSPRRPATDVVRA